MSWPTVVLAGGVLLSLAANLAQAQPTAWGRIVAAVPPAAFLVVVSMIERRAGRRPRLIAGEHGSVGETGRLVVQYNLAMMSRQPDESRRSERARQAIHAATAELLASTSYDAITIEKIAAQAGVGKQTIYRWWPSKAAIIVDVWAEVIAPRVAFPDTGDLEADLRAQLARMLDVLAEPVLGLNYMAVIADSQRDERLAADLSARIFAPRIADTKDRLRSAQAAGQMRDDVDVDTVTDLLYGGIFFRSLFRLVPLDRTQPDALVAALIRGIGPLR